MATKKKKKSSKGKAIAKKDRLEADKPIISTMRAILLFSIGAVIAIAIIVGNNFYEKNKKSCDLCEQSTVEIEQRATLDDPLDLHLLLGRENGLVQPVADKTTASTLLDEIKNSALYELQLDASSVPYAKKETIIMLNILGNEFQKELKKNNMPACKYIITTALTTKISDIEGKSAHSYGTTIDVCATRFICSKKNYNELATAEIFEKTLSKLRNECRLIASRNSNKESFQITTVFYK